MYLILWQIKGSSISVIILSQSLSGPKGHETADSWVPLFLITIVSSEEGGFSIPQSSLSLLHTLRTTKSIPSFFFLPAVKTFPPPLVSSQRCKSCAWGTHGKGGTFPAVLGGFLRWLRGSCCCPWSMCAKSKGLQQSNLSAVIWCSSKALFLGLDPASKLPHIVQTWSKNREQPGDGAVLQNVRRRDNVESDFSVLIFPKMGIDN